MKQITLLHLWINKGYQIQINQKGPRTFVYKLKNLELTDYLISLILNINSQEYKDLVRNKYHARSSYQGYKSVFKTSELAQKFLDDVINPTILMKQINGDTKITFNDIL